MGDYVQYAKFIWNKFNEGKSLSDQEVIEGAKALKELAKDLGETFKWQQAANEASAMAKRLKAIAKQRGIQ